MKVSETKCEMKEKCTKGIEQRENDEVGHMSTLHQQNLELFLRTIVEKRLYSSKRRLRYQMNYLYDGIDSVGKTVIDIRGGSGIHSYYAACCGAKSVVCLEPEGAGSSHGAWSQFQELGSILGYLRENRGIRLLMNVARKRKDMHFLMAG